MGKRAKVTKKSLKWEEKIRFSGGFGSSGKEDNGRKVKNLKVWVKEQRLQKSH